MGNSIENLIRSLARMSTPKFVLLLLGVGALYYMYFYDDGARYDAQVRRIKESIVEEEKVAQRTRALISEKEDIMRGRDNLALKFRNSMKALPNEIDIAELFKGINSTAKSSGIKINSLRPSRIEELEFFDRLPIEIEAEGTFGELALFLSYVARMPRIVRISSFNIRGKRNSRGDVSSDLLVLAGEFVGFRSRPFELKKEKEKGRVPR